MIVCLRTVAIPAAERERFLEWIAENRTVREQHGLLWELVLDPSGSDGATVVITAWPSHQVFEAWIASPERAALTASDVHRAVDYHPITRYDMVGGYINLPGLSQLESAP